jgi:DNA-directed RNA polymerase subunit N (RpoN/RPB10)
MIYLKCPTCSTVLGNRQIIYETGLKEILNNKNLTDKMKEDEKLKLLNSLDLTNYCCKMRVITYVNLTEVLV